MCTYFYPFGKVELVVDEANVEYHLSQLPTQGYNSRFVVDRRRKISITIPPGSSPKSIMCLIKADGKQPDFYVNYESGEQLAAVSFDCCDYRLTIGTEGDLSDRKYSYQRNGLKIILFGSSAERQIEFCIAQKRLHGDIDNVDTWLAADVNCK